MAAMSGVSSQHDNLVVTVWTVVNMVITFELLPVITLLAKISTMVNRVARIAFRAERYLVRFWMSLSERFCTCYSHPVFWARVLLKGSWT